VPDRPRPTLTGPSRFGDALRCALCSSGWTRRLHATPAFCVDGASVWSRSIKPGSMAGRNPAHLHAELSNVAGVADIRLPSHLLWWWRWPEWWQSWQGCAVHGPSARRLYDLRRCARSAWGSATTIPQGLLSEFPRRTSGRPSVGVPERPRWTTAVTAATESPCERAAHPRV